MSDDKMRAKLKIIRDLAASCPGHFWEETVSMIKDEAEAALSQQPESEPEWLQEVAERLHYPQCWDTAAYPTLHSALIELAGCSACSAAPSIAENPSVRAPEFNDAMGEALEEVLRDHGWESDDIGELDKKACWDAMYAESSIAEKENNDE